MRLMSRPFIVLTLVGVIRLSFVTVNGFVVVFVPHRPSLAHTTTRWPLLRELNNNIIPHNPDRRRILVPEKEESTPDKFQNTKLYYQQNHHNVNSSESTIAAPSNNRTEAATPTVENTTDAPPTSKVSIILPKGTVNNKFTANTNQLSEKKVSRSSGDNHTNKYIKGNKWPFEGNIIGGGANLLGKLRERFQRMKPSTKFRWRLGLVVSGIFAILTTIIGSKWPVPTKVITATSATAAVSTTIGTRQITTTTHQSIQKVWKLIQRWLSHRGWQGLAAMGRTIAYGWAVFVAYPRMLDRRQQDRKKQKRTDYVNKRRRKLHRLSDNVTKLRSELRQIDAEIRSFRREIIAMKAYNSHPNINRRDKELDDEGGMGGRRSSSSSTSSDIDGSIQDAIDEEMMDLKQLRQDTFDALVAARKAYAEYRAASPTELLDDDDDDQDDDVIF